MMTLFSDEVRRNPYPAYAQLRAHSPVLFQPESGLWLLFDYEGVKRALNDHEVFSSRAGPNWMIFTDPPRHTKLRALVMRAFTPRMVAGLESRIRELCCQLLDRVIPTGQMDVADDLAVPLPMMVIAQMLGIDPEAHPQFKSWTDTMLQMSRTIPKTAGAAEAADAFRKVTAEMNEHLARVLEKRKAQPGHDLLSGLAAAEIEGDRLTQEEILGFFQLLLLAGSETTTNLINNAVLTLAENPEEMSKLRAHPALLASAIEEVLRYRSPIQWMYRLPTKDVLLHNQLIPAGNLVLAVIGSANRDPKQFVLPDRFDIARDPNPHVAFGHGIHFCLGSALARLESKIALSELLERAQNIELALKGPWKPREGLHVLGPNHLPIRFAPPSSRTIEPPKTIAATSI
jgi:cytochrome P450